MAEPDFYTVHRSGILFERDGVLLPDWNGVLHRYYGIGRITLSGQEIRNGIHTWDDWGLYCTDVAVGAPETERYTVSIPGRHGVLDLSEVLSGNPVYKNRTLTFSFCWLGRMERWHDLYNEILKELHGKTRYVTLDTQPGWHYIGRCSVSSLRQNGVYSTFGVTVDAEPFRRRNWTTDAQWLWDPFNFETDATRDWCYYSGIEIRPGESKSIVLYNCQRIFKPQMTVQHSAIASSGENWYFTVQNSDNRFTEADFSAIGRLTIDLASLSGITYSDNGEVTITVSNFAPAVEGHPEYNVITIGFIYLEGAL